MDIYMFEKIWRQALYGPRNDAYVKRAKQKSLQLNEKVLTPKKLYCPPVTVQFGV